MKKRVLSFLLVFCMLLSLIPAISAAAEEPAEEPRELSSFYDLYSTDGLVALFDAYGADNDTLALADGKWYAKVYEDGAFKKSDSIFATVRGGEYNAETNATGWKVGANGGLSYADPAYQAGETNGIFFDKALLEKSSAFTVESVLQYHMRSIPRETADYTAPEVATADGLSTFTFKGVNPVWRTSEKFVFLIKGDAGTEFTYKIGGTVSFNNGETRTATIGEDGTCTVTGGDAWITAGNLDVVITLSAGVTAEKLTAPIYSAQNEAGARYAFAFGSFYTFVWTNLQGSNSWSNGYGTARWYYASANWVGHNGDYNKSPLVTMWQDEGKTFKSMADTLAIMEVVKNTVDSKDSYAVTFGGTSLFAYNDNGEKPQTIHDFNILCGLEGEVYSLRVYDRTLTEGEKKLNKVADILLKTGYDVATFNGMTRAQQEAALEAVAALDLKASLSDVTVAITNATLKPSDVLTGLRSLYVTDGLVAIYDAFDAGSASVDLATGTWEPLYGTSSITLKGAEKSESATYGWFKGENGGVGYRMTMADWNAHRYEYGVNLSDEFVNFTDFTVEVTAIFAGITEADGSHFFVHADESNQDAHFSKWGVMDSSMSGFRFGTLAAASFVAPRAGYGGNDGLVNRWRFSYSTWKSGNGVDGPTGYGIGGNDGDKGVAQLKSPTAITNYSFTKVTGTSDDVALTYGVNQNGKNLCVGTLTKAKVDEVTAYYNGTYADAVAPFSLFNGYPATLYSVRVYNRALSAEEMQQNRAADLLLYIGFDVAKLETLNEDSFTVFVERLAAMPFTTTSEEVDELLDDLKKIEEEQENATSMTAFDKLYIGADGEATANGGHLNVLLTAYGTAPSVSLDTGIWYDKMGNYNATLVGSPWQKLENGGIGYDLAGVDNNTYMSLPIAALPNADYTIEIVASVRGSTVDGKGETIAPGGMYGISSNNPTFTFGPLHEWLYSGSYNGGYNSYCGNKFLVIYKDGVFGWQQSGFQWTHVLTYTDGVNPDMRILSNSIILTLDGTQSNYVFYKNCSLLTRYSKPTIAKNETQIFTFFRSTGTTALAVRVYDAPLTESEMIYNHFIDLAAYANYDLTEFCQFTADTQLLIAQQMKDADFVTDATVLAATVDAMMEAYREMEERKATVQRTVYDNLYIGADGSTTANGGKLVALFSDYGTDLSAFAKGGTWLPKIGDYTATINGGAYDAETNPTGWVELENGGIGYRDEGYDAKGKNITLPAELLDGDYTVEIIQKIIFRNSPRTLQVVTGDELVRTGNSYAVNLSSNWNATAYATITFKGEPGFTFTPSVYWLNGDQENKSYAGEITLDEEGKASVRCTYRKYQLRIEVPQTVEVESIEAEKYTAENEANSITAYAFGPLTAMLWTNLSGSNTWGNGFGSARWNYGVGDWGATNGTNGCSWWADSSAFVGYDKQIQNFVISRQIDPKTGDQAYKLTYGSAAVLDKVTEAAKTYDVKNFKILDNIPSEVYAIRVYSAPLTANEVAFNRVIDLMAYAGMDPTPFLELTPDMRSLVSTMLGNLDFTSDVTALETSINEVINMFTNNMKPSDYALYVTNGLKVLLTAYNGLSTGTLVSSGATLWASAIEAGQYGTLIGAWTRQPQGGMRIDFTLPEGMTDGNAANTYFMAHNNFGLSFDYSMLPDEDYTVEVVTNPVGITVKNEFGELERFIDSDTVYGINYDYGFVLGPLRCLSFASYRPAGRDGQMEKRWVYLPSGCWGAAGYVSKCTETSFRDLEFDEVITYAIQFNYDKGGSEYNFRKDGSNVGSFRVGTNTTEYIAKDEVKDQRFQLMYGLANTMYAVRIYDRVLSEAELKQNRVADIFYFFGLDTSLLSEALASAQDDAMKLSIFSAFDEMDFTMSKEEAQAMLDSCMAGVWVQSKGIGVRNDMQDALRFYFDINTPTVNALLAAGYQVEIGALLNIGKGVNPDLSSYNYKFVAMDSVSGMNPKYQVDEDTFAFTLNYQNSDRETFLKQLNVVAYISYTDANGDEQIMYGGLPMNQLYAKNTSLFSVYKTASTRDEIRNENEALADYFADTANECYAAYIIYVDENAVVGGDGTKDKPYTDIESAFEKAKHALANLDNPQNVIISLAGGTYSVTEPLAYDGSIVSYPYYNFNIIGSTEDTTNITATLPIASDKFEQDANDSTIFTFRFEADEEGKYPTFRNLYINGETATLSHVGDTNKANGDPYQTRFERETEGTYVNAKQYYDNGELEEMTAEVVYPDRLSLQTAYNTHRNNFLALEEVRALYEEGHLTNESAAPESESAEYKVCFERYRDLFLSSEEGKIPTGEVKDDKPVYKEIAYEYTSDAKKQAKMYLSMDLVGSLQDKVMEKAALLLENGGDEAEIYRTILADSQIEMHMAAQWDFNIVHVVGVDFDDTITYVPNNGDPEVHVAVYFNKDEYTNFQIPGKYTAVGRFVCLQNALEFVDEDGEYYYDNATGVLTVKADNGIEELEIRYPTSDYLFWLENAENVAFSDVTLWGVDDYATSVLGHLGAQAGNNQYGGWAEGYDRNEFAGFTKRSAIFVRNCNNFELAYSVIHDVGGDGLTLRGRVENLNIVDNEMYNIGTTAIRIGDASPAWDKKIGNQNVNVQNNYLHNIATVIHQAPAFQMQSTKDATIVNNTIIGCSYSAMSIGWRWSTVGWDYGDGVNLMNVDISYNYITDFMTELADGGAIYMLGGNATISYTEYFNYIHHNFIVFSKKCGNGLGGMQCGIYFDGSCTNWLCSQNVVVEQSAGADRGGLAGATKEEKELAARRRGTTFIYIQHIDSQLTYNIKCQDNYIFNVRSQGTLEEKRREVYRTYIVASRRIVEEGTRYFDADALRSVPGAIQDIIFSTGAPSMSGDYEWLVENDY